jgi:hypothetical protein
LKPGTYAVDLGLAFGFTFVLKWFSCVGFEAEKAAAVNQKEEMRADVRLQRKDPLREFEQG